MRACERARVRICVHSYSLISVVILHVLILLCEVSLCVCSGLVGQQDTSASTAID